MGKNLITRLTFELIQTDATPVIHPRFRNSFHRLDPTRQLPVYHQFERRTYSEPLGSIIESAATIERLSLRDRISREYRATYRLGL